MKYIKQLEVNEAGQFNHYITEAKKFKIGDKWSDDFDYAGMLAAGLKVNVNTPIKKLNKLFDSFTDVNYHTAAKDLGNAIDWIEDGDKKGASKFMDMFHKAVKEEIKVNEAKDYMKKIDLKDFKKIKKGAKIKYMGGSVVVVNNNGYVITLKYEDGKTVTVNKAQFDHGGMIKEAKAPDANKAIKDLEKIGGQIDYLSDADDATKKIWKKAGVNPEDDNGDHPTIILYSYVNSWPETKKLLDKSKIKYKELEDPNSAGESFIVFNESVNEAKFNKKKLMKAMKKDDGLIMTSGGGEYVIYKFGNGNSDNDEAWQDDFIFAVDQDGEDHEIEYSDIVSYNESSSNDGGDKSNGNSHHDDHKSKSIIQHWKDTYGEDFHSKYPAVAKILKQRPGIDKRELKRIWDETYGENFEEQYPALYNKLD